MSTLPEMTIGLIVATPNGAQWVVEQITFTGHGGEPGLRVLLGIVPSDGLNVSRLTPALNTTKTEKLIADIHEQRKWIYEGSGDFDSWLRLAELGVELADVVAALPPRSAALEEAAVIAEAFGYSGYVASVAIRAAKGGD